MPFVTVHLEIFHCTHHPVIPKSNLCFTFCSTLRTLNFQGQTVVGSYLMITKSYTVQPHKEEPSFQEITLLLVLK